METYKELELTAPPAKDYAKAFAKLFNCKPEEFEITQSYPDGPYLAKYDEGVYEINSDYDLYNQAELYLTEFEQAMLLPVELWIEVAEGVHYEADFYINLLHKLNEKEQAKLTQILTISQAVADPIDSFWRLLYHLSDIEIYPHAVIAAAETYNLEVMKSEVVELLIENGSSYLNELQGGIFETVNLLEDEDDYQLFYIFSVDDANWKVTKEMQEEDKSRKAKAISGRSKKSK